MLSNQHLQKHWIFERNRYLAELDIDFLASVVFPEGFSDHLGTDLECQYLEDRVFQEETVQCPPLVLGPIIIGVY
jgi:hypothetical protein